MKLFQIQGEVARHLRDFFTKKPAPYPIPSHAPKDRKVCFYNPAQQVGGAVYLRHSQLSDICSNVTQAYTACRESEIEPHSLVIGVKGSLQELIATRKRLTLPHTKFVYDPVDELINPTVLSNSGLDGVIASSYIQYSWLRARLAIPVFLLPHHVDLRIDNTVQEVGKFKLAYFGARKNAFLTPELSKRIDIFDMVGHENTNWINQLANYPCHYCVRRKPGKSNSHKPPTKLFIAAKVGAAVITTRDESDAELLLPPDYPFFCASRKPDAIFEMIDFAMGSFGTPIFTKAIADVAHIGGWSENDQCQQLKIMFSLI